MDNNQANDSTDDDDDGGGASVGRPTPGDDKQSTDPGQLLADAGAGFSSSAAGSDSSNSEFVQKPSPDAFDSWSPLTTSFLQVAANTGFDFSVNSPSQRVDSSDAAYQSEVERAAKEETSDWCLPFSRNNDTSLDDDPMKLLPDSPTKKRKFSDTLDNPKSSGFEADSTPTKRLNSNRAPLATTPVFGSRFTLNASGFEPPGGSLVHQNVAGFDGKFSATEPVSQGFVPADFSYFRSLGSGLPPPPPPPPSGAVDLSVFGGYYTGQSSVSEVLAVQPAEDNSDNSYSQEEEDAFYSAIDYSNSFVGVDDDTVTMSNQSSSAGGQPLHDVSVDSSNDAAALLEARGLSSQFLGGFSSRMQHLNERAAASAATGKQVQEILQRLESSKDEDEQLAALIELCQLLVMGNEETLAGFPIRQAVPVLIKLLRMGHNFDIMHQSCRALTYLMEGLPRSSPAVVEAVPLFLEKLQSIECMDVAEQSLRALEILSKKHSKVILQRNGVAASLMFIDFFSMTAQRAALSLTANCCLNMTVEDFCYVQDSLPLITSRLVNQDKKLVESACLCLARLVDNYQSEERILKQIAVHGLLTDIQQLLFVTPSIISTSTLVTVLHMLVVMCYNCPDLAIILLKLNVAETLSYLLVGTSDKGRTSSPPELIPRSSQELYEIVSLIGELMPLLPTDGLFAIDSLFGNNNIGLTKQSGVWQWKDDSDIWRSYNAIDTRIIEMAHQSGEEDVSLTTMGRAYIIDFNIMQQINEDTGTTRQVQRMVNAMSSTKSDSASIKSDSRADVLNENSDLANGLTTALFAVLFEVYNSSAALYLRHKCLRTLLRMLYYGSIDLLSSVLQSVSVSSHVAAMLSSNDLQTVISSIQMCNILMCKLPDIFSIYFRRQGVLHQMNKLIQSAAIDLSTKKKTTSVPSSPAAVSAPPQGASTPPRVSTTPPAASAPAVGAFAVQAASSSAQPGVVGDKLPTPSKDDAKQSTPSPQLRLSDVLKRKKPARQPLKKSSKADDDNNLDPGPSSFFSPSSSSSQSPSSSRSGSSSAHSRLFGVRDSKMGSLTPRTFLASLNPTRWGRSSQSVSDRPLVTRKPSLSKTSPEVLQPTVNNREIIKQWISDQSSKFIEKYFEGDVEGLNHPSLAVFSQLCSSASFIGQDPSTDVKYLQQVSTILSLNDVSPFEVIHSGLIKQLLSYFTSSSAEMTDVRLRTFVQVFIGQPRAEAVSDGHSSHWHLLNPSPLLHLVHKLMICFHHLEQFQIKVHDLGETQSSRGVQVVQLFNAHHIKCNLLPHPDSANLQLWKGGTITIDPFAPITTIERYVLTKGNGKAVTNSEETDEEEDDIEDDDDDDDLDDDDDDDDDDAMEDAEMEDALAMAAVASKSGKHVLEFCIGDHVVPYNLTIYQAVKQFGRASETSEADAESDQPLAENTIWKETHVLWFRPVSSANHSRHEDMQTSEKTKPDKTSKAASNPAAEQVVIADNVNMNRLHVLKSCLVSALPSSVTVNDPALDVLALLRILHSLNSDWTSVFEAAASSNTPLAVSRQEFISNKLTAKANRQLQDPIIVMTGHLPQWLTQIASVCPFLLPFENRLLLFCATSLDRDRAVQRIQDLTMREPTAMDNNEQRQLGTRLERKKKIICRDDLLKQAETAINELIGSRAMLEIQYENEVGSGLGPTLEFYALVSQDLQRADLELWRGEKRALPSQVKGCEEEQQYFYSSCGLFPAPLPKNVKTQVLRRIKSKFSFLGKFMARALIDCRILDLPLSPLFYKWLLGQESTLCISDLQFLDLDLFNSISKLQLLLRDKKRIESDPSHSPDVRKHLLEKVMLDGCTVDDLALDFVLPGYPNVELKKGGKDISVTLDNLEEYIQLVVKWSLVYGVQHQFEAVREGFESIFSLPSLGLFFVEEMDQLFCGSQQEYWNTKYLTEVCQTDHGYTQDSHAVKSLFSILSSYNQEDQRLFLQFVTGSPRLPVGGLRSLNPPLTIVRKTDSKDYADDFLPSVMTCVNYLKLPDYSSMEVMRSKLAIAIREGQLSFLLS